VKARDLGALVALAAVWGGSFLFIRVAAPAVGPIPLAEARVLLAGTTLLLYAAALRADIGLRRRWKSFLVIGLLNSAIPFVFIGAAELYLSAGLAAILNATTPLFGALVAVIWIHERLTIGKTMGLVIGLLGVVALSVWSSLPLTASTLLAVGASLLGALSYGVAGIYAKRAFVGVAPLATATGQQMGAALVLAPLALPVAVTTSPWTHLAPVVIWSILALAIVCTSAAYIVYFHLIASVGPIPALSVTFLVPVFGLLWGALFLHEQITIGTFGGMAIIFAGVLLVMGARMPRAFRRTRAALALAASAESVESGDSIESIGSSR
jgi:drug/metabolite transporter (DMT)-like permease